VCHQYECDDGYQAEGAFHTQMLRLPTDITRVCSGDHICGPTGRFDGGRCVGTRAGCMIEAVRCLSSWNGVLVAYQPRANDPSNDHRHKTTTSTPRTTT
jgi:hypothetical protein